MGIEPLRSLIAAAMIGFAIQESNVCDGAETPSPPVIIPTAETVFPYRFEHASRNYGDVVTFSNQAKATGKVMEWADQVLMYDAGALKAYPVRDVESIDLRRLERHRRVPEMPDLTVAYVERTPRDLSWHGHVAVKEGVQTLDVDPNAPAGPMPGEQVTFRIHILNAGGAASLPVPCSILLDERELVAPGIPAIEPGREHVIDVPWDWQNGPHTLEVRIDPESKAEDANRWNNRFRQPTRALGVAFVVARERYEAFKKTPNMVDSFCFEDYAQYHVACLNALFAASVYPSSPNGVFERVACDRILVVDDPLQAAEWMPSLHRGAAAGGLPEYSAICAIANLGKPDDAKKEALMVSWPALKSIGLQLGLVDLTRTDTRVEQSYVLDIYDRFAMLQYLSPHRASLMHTPGGFPLTEEQAAYLNQVFGRPRGFAGEYLYQLPRKISLDVRATDGSPLRDVQIDTFQLMSEGPEAGRIAGIGRTDPLVSAVTNETGLADLMNVEAPSHRTPNGYELSANPFGRIASDGSNGLLLLRLRAGPNEEFHFLHISTLNVAWLRGQKEEYVHAVKTRFAAPGASLPQPAFAAIEMWERDRKPPPLILTWLVPKGVDSKSVQEFRVYKRTGFAGQQVKPWTLVSVHHPPEPSNFPHGIESYYDEFTYDGPYSLDTYFAVSTVDLEGRESGLSQPGFVTHRNKGVRFAVDQSYAFMTAKGPGLSQMFFWDGRAGTQPHQMKTDNFESYKPGFEGIAFAPDGRLFVTDPVNHVLAIYDVKQSELTEVLPKRDAWPGEASDKPGEFNEPADLAIDDNGKIYVADRANHRVQILGAGGEYIGLLDPDFRFRRPFALGYASGHVCVTDKNGRRCRVYDIRADEPKFAMELPPLVDADRAIVNTKGRVYVTGRPDHVSPWTVLAFEPDGLGGAVPSEIGTTGEMGSYEKPRSLYLHRQNSNYVYMMNEFPFDVRRCYIEN
ncbi:MAG TPA: CARDB domain-containing protein [Phycisphaerae bacterium]|nr:CARDB domain-containing protein [Phycisphaerae bacterium]